MLQVSSKCSYQSNRNNTNDYNNNNSDSFTVLGPLKKNYKLMMLYNITSTKKQ